MPKIKKSVHSDNDITPTAGKTNINHIEQAEIDHDQCTYWNAIMDILTNEGLSNEYRLARLKLMIETLQEGLNQLKTQTNA